LEPSRRGNYLNRYAKQPSKGERSFFLIGAELVSTDSSREQLIEKLKDKEYRDLFVAEQIFARLPMKIHLLRELRKWTQKSFGEKTGMAQAWVSKLEDPNYGRLTLSTLLKVASTFDVALVVDFVPFSKLLNDTLGLSVESFKVPSFGEDFGETAAPLASAQASATVYARPIKDKTPTEETQHILTADVSPSHIPSYHQDEVATQRRPSNVIELNRTINIPGKSRAAQEVSTISVNTRPTAETRSVVPQQAA